MDLMQPMPYTAFQAMLDGFAPKRLAELPPRAAPARLADDDHRPVPGGRPRHRLADDAGHHVQPRRRDRPGARGRHGGRQPEAPLHGAPDRLLGDARRRPTTRWTGCGSSPTAVAPATTGGTYLNFEPGTTIADVKSGFGEDEVPAAGRAQGRLGPGQPVPVQPQRPADRLAPAGCGCRGRLAPRRASSRRSRSVEPAVAQRRAGGRAPSSRRSPASSRRSSPSARRAASSRRAKDVQRPSLSGLIVQTQRLHLRAAPFPGYGVRGPRPGRAYNPGQFQIQIGCSSPPAQPSRTDRFRGATTSDHSTHHG